MRLDRHLPESLKTTKLSKIGERSVNELKRIIIDQKSKIKLLEEIFQQAKVLKINCDKVDILSIENDKNSKSKPNCINKSVQINLLKPVNQSIDLKLKSYSIDELRVKVSELRSESLFEGKNLIGGHWTIISLKSQNSYLIGTMKKGLRLRENGVEIYSGRLPIKDASFRDIIYIPLLDCYLIVHNNKLYRKDIDEKPPYLFMGVNCGFRQGSGLRYSKIHQRLVIIRSRRNISVINLQTKAIEIESSMRKRVVDFRLFGNSEDQVILVTQDGFIMLYIIDFAKKIGSVVDQYEMLLNVSLEEIPKSLAVCSKNKYIFVEVGRSLNNTSSRMAIFKVSAVGLTREAILDNDSDSNWQGQKYALEYFTSVGRCLLWIGLSRRRGGYVQVYSYDTESGEFKEMKEKRVLHLEDEPLKLDRIGKKFFYTGALGKVMRIKLTV